MDNLENIKMIVDRKLDFLNTVSDTSMLWWVSVVVFCGTVIGVVLGWKEKLEALPSYILKFFSFIVLIFLTSVVGYGYLVIEYADKSHKELKLLLPQIQVSPSAFDCEYSLLKYGMTFGISTFVLTLIAWMFISIWLISKK